MSVWLLPFICGVDTASAEVLSEKSEDLGRLIMRDLEAGYYLVSDGAQIVIARLLPSRW